MRHVVHWRCLVLHLLLLGHGRHVLSNMLTHPLAHLGFGLRSAHEDQRYQRWRYTAAQSFPQEIQFNLPCVCSLLLLPRAFLLLPRALLLPAPPILFHLGLQPQSRDLLRILPRLGRLSQARARALRR